MNVKPKSPEAITIMAEAGHILAQILTAIARAAHPGVTTQELDALANDLCRRHHVKPAFLGYNGYPAVLCASVNSVIVHGIPAKDVLRSGDVVGLDMGIKHRGYFSDMAVTVPIGRVKNEEKELLDVTHQALDSAIAMAKPGITLGDLGAAISEVAEKYGYGVIRELSGHGIGRRLQEPPSVPNFGKKGTGLELEEGMTIAIEPMFALGHPAVRTKHDGWTVALQDGSIGAHFEHTITITKNGSRILTR